MTPSPADIAAYLTTLGLLVPGVAIAIEVIADYLGSTQGTSQWN